VPPPQVSLKQEGNPNESDEPLDALVKKIAGLVGFRGLSAFLSPVGKTQVSRTAVTKEEEVRTDSATKKEGLQPEKVTKTLGRGTSRDDPALKTTCERKTS